MEESSGDSPDRYSYADRTALSEALAMLMRNCDCHVQPWCGAEREPDDPTECKMCPSSQRFRMSDGSTYCPFQPGSAIAVGPDGGISYARSPHGSPDYGASFYEKRGAGRPFAESPHWPQLPEGRSPAAPDGLAPEAPLAAAFRTVRAGHGGPPGIRFRVPARAGAGVGARSATLDCPPMRTRKIPIPRNDLKERIPTYMEGIEHDVARHEDHQIAREVVQLRGGETFVCRPDATLADLEGFVAGLNSGRPEGLLLDTVLVNYPMYLVLFGNDPRTPDWAHGYPDYRNMTTQGGIAFLHYAAVQHEYGYAMSREQGPVFVHGPTTVSCGETELEVERHFAVASPPIPEIRGIPWGVRFNVEMGMPEAERPG